MSTVHGYTGHGQHAPRTTRATDNTDNTDKTAARRVAEPACCLTMRASVPSVISVAGKGILLCCLCCPWREKKPCCPWRTTSSMWITTRDWFGSISVAWDEWRDRLRRSSDEMHSIVRMWPFRQWMAHGSECASCVASTHFITAKALQIPGDDCGIDGRYSSAVRDERQTWEGRSGDHQTTRKVRGGVRGAAERCAASRGAGGGDGND